MPVVTPSTEAIVSRVTAGGTGQAASTTTTSEAPLLVYASQGGAPYLMSRRDLLAPTENERHKFRQLADQWREQTRAVSSDSDIVANFAYHQIMGMGERALPFIFDEMQTHGGRWFWALRAITGENPVRPEDRGNVRRMTATWLEWARVHDYV
jgi:hypothetical protein